MERDIVKRIEDLMNLFDEGEVTTADQTQRPEDPYRDFMDRNPQANGGRIGFSNGGSEDYIYTRPSGAKRLVIGDTIYGSVAKGDEEGLKALKKKRDKLIKTLPNLRKQYDLESLKKEWRNTLSTKKAVNWEKFLKTKFPKDSTTPDAIRKKTETDFRNDISDFNPKEEFKIKVKQKQNLEKIKLAKKLVKEHKDSEKVLYDKKTIYKKLGFTNIPQVEKIDAKTGIVRKSLFNEAIVNEVNKLVPVKQKVNNAFDKILNEDIKIYEPKGGTKDQGGIIKKMISDIISPKGGPKRYQVSVRLINNALNEHQPYLDIKDNFDYLDFKLAKKMKGNTLNEALDYAKYVRGGLEMKNIEKLTNRFLLPESNVFRFALRSAFNNYKAENIDPPVRVFNLNADGTPGKEVDFAKLKIDYSTNMRVIDTNKIGFTYNDEFFTKKNLRTKGYQSGFFNEVYKLTAKGNISVPDPNNPNKNITLNKLLQLNKDKLTIGHNDAKGGVTKLPFSDLRLEGNKINTALYNAYNKIKNKPLRKLVVNKLQGDFGFLKGDDYERAFIEGEKNKAKNIGKKNIALNPLYKQAGQDVIKDLGKDIFKQTKPFQKEAARVAGVKNINNFLKNLENKKFGKVADVMVKASQEGGFGKTIQTICKRRKAKKGGRMFFSEGPGCPAAKDDPKGFLKSVSDNPQLAKFFKSVPGQKAAAAAARVTGNVLNPTTLIGGEVAYVLGDGLNNFASGLPLDESFDRAFIFSDFEKFEKNLMNQAKELGYDDNQLNLLQQTININKLDNRQKKLQFGLEVEKQDPSVLTSDATMGFEDRLVKTNKNLDDSIINYLGTLDKMGFDSNKASDQETGFTYLDNVFKKRTQDQLVKDFEDRKKQVDPTQTPFGDFISPVFDLESYTQPLKFAADIINPFTKDVPFLSERQREAKRLKEMDPRELYLYNKQRGFTLDDIQQGTSPQIRPVMDYLGTDVTGQGFGSQFLAGGGIAGLSGGDKSGPPPERGPNPQGLPSLLKRVRNI